MPVYHWPLKAVPTVLDGIRYDSKSEGRRAGELALLCRAGEVRWVLRQVGVDLGCPENRYRELRGLRPGRVGPRRGRQGDRDAGVPQEPHALGPLRPVPAPRHPGAGDRDHRARDVSGVGLGIVG